MIWQREGPMIVEVRRGRGGRGKMEKESRAVCVSLFFLCFSDNNLSFWTTAAQWTGVTDAALTSRSMLINQRERDTKGLVVSQKETRIPLHSTYDLTMFHNQPPPRTLVLTFDLARLNSNLWSEAISELFPSDRGLICSTLFFYISSSSSSSSNGAAIPLTEWQMRVLPLAHQPCAESTQDIRESRVSAPGLHSSR